MVELRCAFGCIIGRPGKGIYIKTTILPQQAAMRNVLLFLFFGLVTGCGSSSFSHFSTGTLGSAPRTMAVFPLTNLTTHPYAGQIFGELLFTDLKNVHQFSVVSNTESWKAFQGKETDLEEAALHQNMRQAALQLGVDTVLFGSVTEYRYKRGIDEEPVVGVTIRLMDVPTGDILWGASLSRVGGCCSFGGDALSITAQGVCKEIVRSLLKESPPKAGPKSATAG